MNRVDANENSMSLHEPRSGSTIVTVSFPELTTNRVAVGQIACPESWVTDVSTRLIS